jgi:ArsR family metal-binding transcriptional regulator
MNEKEYLTSIGLAGITPCLAEPDRVIVSGKPNRSLDEVLPYLAALPDVLGFNPETGTLTFRRPRGFITLYSQRIVITQVKDESEGIDLLNTLAEAINATWENRHQITPVTSRKKPAGHLEIYKLLPGTNCKTCGEETCLAFAVGLVTGARNLAECLPIYNEPDYKERRLTLESML